MILQFSSSNYRLNQYVWGHILTPVDNKTTVKTCIVYNIIIFWAFLPLLHSKVVKKHRKAGGEREGEGMQEKASNLGYCTPLMWHVVTCFPTQLK